MESLDRGLEAERIATIEINDALKREEPPEKHCAWNDRPGIGNKNDRPGIGNKYVARIAVRRERMRNESVVARIAHRRIEKAVHDKRPRFLIHLVFYRLATNRYLDDRVYLFGRISADEI
jgi:hypothetical protein